MVTKMKTNKIKKQIYHCISKHSDVSIKEIKDTLYLKRDLGIDSMSFIDILVTLEDIFYIYIENDIIKNYDNLNVYDLCNYVLNKI